MNIIRPLLAAFLLTAACHADTIGSFATGASNLGNVNSATNFAGASASNVISVGTGNSYFLDPGTTWIAAGAHSTWVGYAPTAGPGGGVNPPGSLLNPEFYTFTTTFSQAGNWHGFLGVAADDTTEVFLNGVLLGTDGALGVDSHCADGVPNCSVITQFNIAGLAGLNTLTFVVEQAGFTAGDPSGLDFTGEVTTVPEPSSFLLFGTGLIAAGHIVRRRFAL